MHRDNAYQLIEAGSQVLTALGKEAFNYHREMQLLKKKQDLELEKARLKHGHSPSDQTGEAAAGEDSGANFGGLGVESSIDTSENTDRAALESPSASSDVDKAIDLADAYEQHITHLAKNESCSTCRTILAQIKTLPPDEARVALPEYKRLRAAMDAGDEQELGAAIEQSEYLTRLVADFHPDTTDEIEQDIDARIDPS